MAIRSNATTGTDKEEVSVYIYTIDMHISKIFSVLFIKI